MASRRGNLRDKEPVKASATAADDDTGDGCSPANWALQIELAEKRNEVWERRCKKIVQRYREERPDSDSATATRRMNILWSNVETLRPCIYGREPVPIAERRFLDRDVVGRVGSQILERSMRYQMADCGFHDTLEQSVQDYLLCGRGVAWLRYKPIIGASSSLADEGDDELPEDDDDGGDEPEETEGDAPTQGPPAEKVLSASLEVDYVHWTDFLTSNARFWKETEWVSRKIYSSRKDLCDDFGDEIGKAVPLEMSPEHANRSGGRIADKDIPNELKKAIVYEIWHKPTRKVYTIAKGFDRFLEEPREDPLNLEGFWPCPRPLFATMTNDTLEPVPDYIEYQDQALEIDELTARINLLTKALKVAGVYDASQKQLSRLLDESHENKLIPVSSWAAFAEKGGLANAVSFLPIKEVSDVLMALFEARDKIKQDLYEITGIADIVRGQADPRETATAVQTKGRWGSLRLQARQVSVARFCRDIIRMMGEIIAEHFPDETLIATSGIMYDEGVGPEPPQAPKAPQPAPPGAMVAPAGLPPGSGPGLGPAPAGGPPGPPPGLPVQPGPAGPPIAPSPPQQPLPAQAGPPVPPGVSPLPMGVPVAPIPQVDPAIAAYHAAMAQYQHAMAQNQAEKSALVMKAIDLLRNEKLRGFRIDIETDSTVENDATEEKQNRIEFIKAVSTYIEQAFQIGAQSPDAVPMLGKMLLFGVRGFRAGRDLESTIEEFVDRAEKTSKQQQGAPPRVDPKVQSEQLQLQAQQAQAEAEVTKARLDAQSSAEDNQREMASKKLDAEIAAQQAQTDMARMQQEAQYRQAEFAQRMEELRMKAQIAERGHAQSMQAQAGAVAAKAEAPSEPTPYAGEAAPVAGARRSPKDGNWYVPHAFGHGKHARVDVHHG